MTTPATRARPGTRAPSPRAARPEVPHIPEDASAADGQGVALRGTLGFVLTGRLVRSAHDEQAQAYDAPTLDQAVMSVMRLVHGVSPRTFDEELVENRYVFYALDSIDATRHPHDVITEGRSSREGSEVGRIAMVTLPRQSRDQWHLDASPEDRERLLISNLSSAFLTVGTIDQWVRQPRSLSNPLASIAVVLWWEARMTEGFTVEAACTMLSLLVDRSRLADIEALLADTFEGAA